MSRDRLDETARALKDRYGPLLAPPSNPASRVDLVRALEQARTAATPADVDRRAQGQLTLDLRAP